MNIRAYVACAPALALLLTGCSNDSPQPPTNNFTDGEGRYVEYMHKFSEAADRDLVHAAQTYCMYHKGDTEHYEIVKPDGYLSQYQPNFPSVPIDDFPRLGIAAQALVCPD